MTEWTGAVCHRGVEESDACMALNLNSSQRSLLQGHEVLVYYYRWLQHFPGSESARPVAELDCEYTVLQHVFRFLFETPSDYEITHLALR